MVGISGNCFSFFTQLNATNFFYLLFMECLIFLSLSATRNLSLAPFPVTPGKQEVTLQDMVINGAYFPALLRRVIDR